jgi:phenylacetate-CoA ligase
VTGADDLDALRLSIEIGKGADADAVTAAVADATKATFEVTPEVVVLEPGTLAKEFESSIKAPRFADRRG